MNPTQFRRNRAAFPWSEIEKYRGQWIAFSADGTRVIAAADTMAAVDQKVRASGFDPEEVVFEGVPWREDGPDLDDGNIA